MTLKFTALPQQQAVVAFLYRKKKIEGAVRGLVYLHMGHPGIVEIPLSRCCSRLEVRRFQDVNLLKKFGVSGICNDPEFIYGEVPESCIVTCFGH